MTHAPSPPRRRRALTHVGGEIDVGGDRDVAAMLAHALDVTTSEALDAPERAHVHGFHAYPARAHPVTVARLIEALSSPRATILDPFCGSGTVAVESLLAGRAAVGTDLNPIAVALAKAKVRRREPGELEALVRDAAEVAALATERRRARTGASRRYGRDDVASFAPHVLLELDGLRLGIDQRARPETRDDLSLVLSAIVVKVSQRRGDTSSEVDTRRIAAGFPTKLFVRKAEDFARRIDQLERALGSARPHATIFEANAFDLSRVAPASVDSVVTSPPYAATYDYFEHHELRLRWLSMSGRAFEQGELGARRRYAALDGRAALETYLDEWRRLLASLARVVRPGGTLALLVADSAVGRTALRADDGIAEVARERRDFRPLARASQARPHFHGPTQAAFRDGPRREHALVLERV